MASDPTECMAVVQALGGSFAFPLMEFVAGSMALDIARGVPTEIDELTGFIVREGELLNSRAPTAAPSNGWLRGLNSPPAPRC